MAAEIVNLRQFRKRAERVGKQKTAEQNRLSHGRAKAEKSLTRALNDKAAKRLDQGHIESTNHDLPQQDLESND